MPVRFPPVAKWALLSTFSSRPRGQSRMVELGPETRAPLQVAVTGDAASRALDVGRNRGLACDRVVSGVRDQRVAQPPSEARAAARKKSAPKGQATGDFRASRYPHQRSHGPVGKPCVQSRRNERCGCRAQRPAMTRPAAETSTRERPLASLGRTWLRQGVGTTR